MPSFLFQGGKEYSLRAHFGLPSVASGKSYYSVDMYMNADTFSTNCPHYKSALATKCIVLTTTMEQYRTVLFIIA